jgi:hypothetical protein
VLYKHILLGVMQFGKKKNLDTSTATETDELPYPLYDELPYPLYDDFRLGYEVMGRF